MEIIPFPSELQAPFENVDSSSKCQPPPSLTPWWVLGHLSSLLKLLFLFPLILSTVQLRSPPQAAFLASPAPSALPLRPAVLALMVCEDGLAQVLLKLQHHEDTGSLRNPIIYRHLSPNTHVWGAGCPLPEITVRERYKHPQPQDESTDLALPEHHLGPGP